MTLKGESSLRAEELEGQAVILRLPCWSWDAGSSSPHSEAQEAPLKTGQGHKIVPTPLCFVVRRKTRFVVSAGIFSIFINE